MFLTDRKMTPEFLHFSALSKRTVLNAEDARNFKIYESGFSGECLYDKIFDEVGHDNLYIYRDVYLAVGKTGAQYDSIIISGDAVTVNEIKNYSGEYHYKDGRFIKNGEIIPDNPFSQVDRAAGKLYRIFRNHKISAEISAKVIFPNDDFRLYSEDNSIWKNVVIRMDMKKYFRQFKDSYNTEKADRLVALVKGHIRENPYFNGSSNVGLIRKGLYCGECSSFELVKGRYHFTCSRCKSKESIETSVLRAISDYKHIYFKQVMTCRLFMNFINSHINQRAVQRYLLKYCNVIKKGNETQYQFKYYEFSEAVRETKAQQKYKNTVN